MKRGGSESNKDQEPGIHREESHEAIVAREAKERKERAEGAITRAREIKDGAMRDKFSELTREPKERVSVGVVESRVLALDSVRRKMAEAGLLSDQAMEGVRAAYTERSFRASDLGALKERFAEDTTSEKFGTLHEVPEEAVSLEQRALAVLPDVRNGWAGGGASFNEALRVELDRVKLKKLGVGEAAAAPGLAQGGFEELEESIRRAKHDMFGRMLNHGAEDPRLSEGQRGWKQRFES